MAIDQLYSVAKQIQIFSWLKNSLSVAVSGDPVSSEAWQALSSIENPAT
jgi:hypothetical protein